MGVCFIYRHSAAINDAFKRAYERLFIAFKRSYLSQYKSYQKAFNSCVASVRSHCMADQASSQPSSAASTENGLGRLLYRVDEVRRATALSRADVYRRINAGEIPHVRV